jgi:hypothetical protein
LEKAREIQVKADEEFAIEKVRSAALLKSLHAHYVVVLKGKAREAGTTGYRRTVREEAQGC